MLRVTRHTCRKWRDARDAHTTSAKNATSGTIHVLTGTWRRKCTPLLCLQASYRPACHVWRVWHDSGNVAIPLRSRRHDPCSERAVSHFACACSDMTLIIRIGLQSGASVGCFKYIIRSGYARARSTCVFRSRLMTPHDVQIFHGVQSNVCSSNVDLPPFVPRQCVSNSFSTAIELLNVHKRYASIDGSHRTLERFYTGLPTQIKVHRLFLGTVLSALITRQAMNYKRNTVARSRNYWYRGKAVNIKY